ncbi:MAG: ATP-grasp domain-containing protein [Gammaproteobacteria bacterium]|nr:ATP-grasp domain-containing protein [Gammaproteobacteria bacterium]
MPIQRLLIANRGEIAIRIAQATSDLAISSVGIHSIDDASSLHVKSVDDTYALDGVGVKAYLDIEQIVSAAKEMGCDAVHPGYGFLAESAEFAAAVEDAGLIFVGPAPATLALCGDKSQARKSAVDVNVPVVVGTDQPTSLDEVIGFFNSLGPNKAIMIKAIAGGGGRGTRVVSEPKEIASAYERCQSEATAAFGNGDLYVEELIEEARHIEVQVVGDAKGHAVDFHTRECSAQRRHQKLIEVAPAFGLPDTTLEAIEASAVKIAESLNYRSLGTFEFLVDAKSQEEFAFIEANARLQVEHTVTEMVTGLDLVQTQLRLAGGETFDDLQLDSWSKHGTTGYAIQCRVNMEEISPTGDVLPSGGTISRYEMPTGPGIRVDGFGYSGYTTSPHFDSLLSKIIVSSRSENLDVVIERTKRALENCHVEGVRTNIAFLRQILGSEAFRNGDVTTRWVDRNVAQLAEAAGETEDATRTIGDAASGLAGGQIDSRDPLALFEYADAIKKAKAEAAAADEESESEVNLVALDGSIGQAAPIQGTVVSVKVQEGDAVAAGQELVIMEAMKMEHVISASVSGIVRKIDVEEGNVIQEGYPLVFVEAAEVEVAGTDASEEADLDHIRGDLQESIDRRQWIYDEHRPKAMERRERTGQQTARKNINDLCDDGSFIEYGPLVLAAQRRRRTEQWLRENTPADGLICGVGTVNSHLFPDHDARCVAVAYDYTVFAGTQGHKNHYKQDRIFELANRFRLPVILFSEGGGGRPGDTDGSGGVGMDTYTFTQWSKLSARVPLVGVNSGRCFAGNTALLGCCDVIIATKKSTIAMGGPAMIEGGGLGIYTPEEVGPMSFQVPNGVVDIIVDDEQQLIETAKKYISYFQGSIEDWEAPDQRKLRHVVPENRLRMYNVRDVIHTLADVDSVLEIRENFGIGIVTCFLRVEGKPFGLIANNAHHLAGAIDTDGADKAARFLQLCDAFDLPVISIMDCPGIMVGPEVEKTALVRHSCRLFNTGANLSVPMFGVIIRKAYGLGVQAMCGGSSLVPFFCVAWPTAEFAGMNIEGSVKLGYRNELMALETAEERIKRFDEMVASSYERAKAVNSATFFGVDDVIDPATTRSWIVRGMKSLPEAIPRETKKRPYVDTW